MSHHTNLKVFSDFHHAGAARGLALLFDRMDSELWFPDVSFSAQADKVLGPGVFMPCMPGWVDSMGGFPSNLRPWTRSCSYQQFMETDWDAVLITRLETQKYFYDLLQVHPKGMRIKRIAMTGNDGAQFDWNFIPNFMSSDYAAYMMSPNDLHKIWYSQEMGLQYQDCEYSPITDANLKTVNCFINCWNTFTQPWSPAYDFSHWGGKCPHCHRQPPVENLVTVKPYEIWDVASKLLPNHSFKWYGMGSPNGCLEEKDLVPAYKSGAVTVHMKTYDGYGFSVLQSIACGRPVIVPRGFFRYRTAGKYLIPNLTCYEVDWDGNSLARKVDELTKDTVVANENAICCMNAAQSLFDWGYEAWRVERFMGELR